MFLNVVDGDIQLEFLQRMFYTSISSGNRVYACYQLLSAQVWLISVSDEPMTVTIFSNHDNCIGMRTKSEPRKRR